MTFIHQPSPEEMEFNMLIRFLDLSFDDKDGYRDTVNQIVCEAIKFRKDNDIMKVPSEHFHSIILISGANKFMDRGIAPENMTVTDYLDLRAELIENGHSTFFL